MVREQQGFTQAIRVLVGQRVAVKPGMGCVDDSMMVGAQDDDVLTHVPPAFSQIVNMVRLRERRPIVWFEVMSAYLAVMVVIGLQRVCQCRIANELFAGVIASRRLQ